MTDSPDRLVLHVQHNLAAVCGPRHEFHRLGEFGDGKLGDFGRGQFAALEQGSGEIVNIDKWGRRRLAEPAASFRP